MPAPVSTTRTGATDQKPSHSEHAHTLPTALPSSSGAEPSGSEHAHTCKFTHILAHTDTHTHTHTHTHTQRHTHTHSDTHTDVPVLIQTLKLCRSLHFRCRCLLTTTTSTLASLCVTACVCTQNLHAPDLHKATCGNGLCADQQAQRSTVPQERTVDLQYLTHGIKHHTDSRHAFLSTHDSLQLRRHTG